MAKRIKGVTLERQDRWYAHHRSSYEDDQSIYEPFWRCDDIRSSGIKVKIPHFKTPNRIVHLLSLNELWAYLHLVRNPLVVEVYEQVAIPLEASLAIANELEVQHPVYIGTTVPAIQTIDFVAEVVDLKTGELLRKSFPVKQPKDAEKFRTAEKLAIQEIFSVKAKMDYELVTSNVLRTNLSVNLELLYRYRNLPDYLQKVSKRFLNNFFGCLHDDRHQKTSSLLELASTHTGVDYNTGISIFYHALWHKKIVWNEMHLLKLEMAASDLGLQPND